LKPGRKIITNSIKGWNSCLFIPTKFQLKPPLRNLKLTKKVFEFFLPCLRWFSNIICIQDLITGMREWVSVRQNNGNNPLDQSPIETEPHSRFTNFILQRKGRRIIPVNCAFDRITYKSFGESDTAVFPDRKLMVTSPLLITFYSPCMLIWVRDTPIRVVIKSILVLHKLFFISFFFEIIKSWITQSKSSSWKVFTRDPRLSAGFEWIKVKGFLQHKKTRESFSINNFF